MGESLNNASILVYVIIAGCKWGQKTKEAKFVYNMTTDTISQLDVLRLFQHQLSRAVCILHSLLITVDTFCLSGNVP